MEDKFRTLLIKKDGTRQEKYFRSLQYAKREADLCRGDGEYAYIAIYFRGDGEEKIIEEFRL